MPLFGDFKEATSIGTRTRAPKCDLVDLGLRTVHSETEVNYLLKSLRAEHTETMCALLIRSLPTIIPASPAPQNLLLDSVGMAHRPL